jgi:hypothetical protein
MIDNFSMLDNGKRPYYNFKHFLIKINFELKQILEDTSESIVQYSEFIHEYTHYLQSFTTTNSMYAMLSYYDAIDNILSLLPKRIIDKNYDFKELINLEKDNFLNSRLRLYWQCVPLSCQNKSTNLNYIVKKYFNPVFNKKTNEIFIFNIFDHKYYHISTKVLRENMAQMATFFVRGLGMTL